MLFNSFEFAIFLPIVFLLYWFVFQKNLKAQNLFIVAISYLFYGWWDWRFLLLIALTTVFSYLSGILIQSIECKALLPRSRSKAKIVAAINIIINLVILCIFKYFNFFTENLSKLFMLFGYELDWVTLDILLPVGISFYTFQALSYTIDVYKHKIEPTHDIVSFFAFLSFFPQLVAGPIERATNLLPQFMKGRIFDYSKAIDGMRQILWGLFKKIVIADNCAVLVNEIFGDYVNISSPKLLLGALYFTFQIYGDFSGYSDIAIGTAKLFGINLMKNFNFPYFALNIADFWRRWHISLTTWFRDYLYIPLGGSRVSKPKVIVNTFIIFLMSGFWHGANWTFLAWGAYHAVLFLPLLLLGKNKKDSVTTISSNGLHFSMILFFKRLITFLLVVIGWVFFRSESIYDACLYLKHMLLPSDTVSGVEFLFQFFISMDMITVPAIIVLMSIEWFQRFKNHALQIDFINSRIVRWMCYLVIIYFIYAFPGSSANFIYFQF